MANGDNLLLGAEVVLEDSKTIESEVLKKIDTIQKKIDKDPLEMKISVGEMKGIATSLTKVRNALSKEADKISKEISSMGAVSGLSPDQQTYYSQLVEKQKQLNALSDSLLTTQSKIRAEASQLNGEANSISKGIAKAASEAEKLEAKFMGISDAQKSSIASYDISAIKGATKEHIEGMRNYASYLQLQTKEMSDEWNQFGYIIQRINALIGDTAKESKELADKTKGLSSGYIDRDEALDGVAIIDEINKETEESIRLEKEHLETTKQRTAEVTRLNKLYANLTSEQRRQVRSGNIGNISADTEGVLKRMIKYSKEYATHVGLSNKEVKAQEALVQSLNAKLAKVTKEAKLASAEYQALSKVVKKGAASLIPEDTTLSNDVLKERLAMSELIASSLRTHTKEYAKHLAYQQSIKEALKYQSAEAIKALESQAKTMDESSIDARNAKIAVYEKLLKQVNDTTEEGIKKQKEYVAVVNRLTTANAKAKSREADLEKEKAATQKVTDEKNRQLKIEENIKAILSGTATTENIITEAIRQRVKQQKDLVIGSEAYLQNEREINQLTEKLPANIRKSTEAYSNQASVVQQMKGMVDDYIGLYAIFRGMDSIVQTTADFEMQKVALTALSGSMIDTEKIWSQIAAQSVKSPFALKDLVTYTKQLSAYRIENDKLFDTTKQLADISAGLGVEMGRIILAYGQVKAATVLRGTELRQFTEAGFDLLPALAQKFTELNGTVVTTAEVFDLISERAVPFEMVAEVFDDMTAAGGRFYNMQEIQSDTTRGLLINIQDQADLTKVALGEMNEGLIKAVLSGQKGVLEFAANNAGLVNSILAVGGAFAVYQLTLGVQNEIMRRYNKTVLDSITTKKLERLEFDKTTAAKIKEALATKGSTAATKLNSIELTKATTRQRLYIASLKYTATASNFLTRGLGKLSAAMIANPWTFAIAALTAISGVISSVTAKAKQQREAIRDLRTEYVKFSDDRARAEKTLKEATDFESQKKAFKEYQAVLKNQGVEISMTFDEEGLSDRIAATIKEGEAKAKFLEDFKAQGKVIDVEDDVEVANKSIGDYRAAVAKAMGDIQRAMTTLPDFDVVVDGTSISTIDELRNKLNELSKDSSLSGLRKMEEALRDVGQAIYWLDYNKYGSFFVSLERGFENFGGKAYGSIAGDDIQSAYKKFLSNMARSGEAITNDSNPIDIRMALNNGDYEGVKEEIAKLIETNFPSLVINLKTSEEPQSFLADWQKDLNANLANIRFEYLVDITPADVDTKGLEKFVGLSNTAFSNLTKGVASGKDFDDEFSVTQATIDSWNSLDSTQKRAVNSGRTYLTDLEIRNTEQAKQVTIEAQLEDFLKTRNSLLKKQAVLQNAVDDNGLVADVKELESVNRELADTNRQITESYGVLALSSDKGGVSKSDKAVSLLKEELSLLDDVNKAYADNLKVMSPDAAAKAITDLYGDVFDDLKNFKGLKPTDVIDVSGLNSQYEKAKTIINKLLGEGTAKANKVILEFDKATTQNSAKEAMAIVKAEIDKLNKDIAKQQEASNFMDKILGLTSGNMELATSITMSVYGNTGEELEKAMVEQVRKAFSGGGVSSAVAKGVEDAIDGTDVDYVALQGLIEQLPEDMQSAAEKIVKEGISANAKIVEDLYKNLSKAKTYEDKRTDILRAGIKQRREIEESDLKDSEKAYFTGLSKESESKQLKQLEFTDFKESDMYIQMFDRLETTSTATLDIMKRKLEGMREAWKDGLEPTQLKELQSRLNEISDELDTRGNPFTALKESITEYRAELAKANLAQREAALLEAQDIESEKKSTADDMGDSLASSELALIEARKSNDPLRIAAAEALYRLNLANYNEANKEYLIAKETTETRQKDVNTLTTLDGKIIKLRKSTRALKQDLVTSMVDFASASNDAIQAGVFGNLSDEVEGVVDSVVSAGMEIAQVTTSTIGAIQDTMEGAVWGMKAAAETGKEAISSVEKASVILAVISAALQIATKIADAIGGAKDAQADADIEKAQMEVDSLNNSIDDLGDKADESFGKAKIGAMKMQDELREQQALAYDAMILAEQSRKEPDEAQIAEWQRAGDLLRKEIADTGDYLEAYLGMDKMSAMTALKDAWMDIWSDMSSTPAERMDAIKNKWKEMLREMLVNQMMMSVVSRQMDAFFDKIGDQIEAKGGELTEADYQAMLNEGLGLIEGLAPQMELLGQTMEKMGLRDIADAAEDTNGSLAQGVASATSEEVTTLSGYMSSVLQYQILSYAILDRWEKTGYGGVTIAGTDSKAQDGTFHLAAISTNTLNAANTLAEIREILDGVTTPIGSDKGISINVDVVG